MIVRNDKRAIITSDLVVGHEYEVVVRAIGPDGTNQAMENAARNVITIKGKQAAPTPPTDLAATGFINAISLSWVNPDDYDFDHIEVWRAGVDDSAMALKAADTYGIAYFDVIGIAGVTRYYWIRAVNTSGFASDYYPNTPTGIGATTLQVMATDIDDFAVTATKMFTNTIVLTGDAWTNNSPTVGKIAWNAHTIVYNGASYPISAGNTALAYIYWTIGATTYTSSATHPALGTVAFMIAINTAGIHTLVWNSSANMVIGTAFIADLAVTDAKIALLAVTEAKIANLAVTDAKINSLGASKITTGTLYSQSITLLCNGAGDTFINSGKADFTNVGTGFILGVDDSDGDKPKFYIGDANTYLNWTGAALAIKGSVTITGGSGIASLTDAGDLAVLDVVGASNCDTTIISGGKIITGLLTADNVQAGTLTGRTVQTAIANQRVIISGADNTLAFYNSAGNLAVKLDGDAAYGTVPTLTLGNYGGNIVTYNDANNNIQIISAPAAGTGAKNSQITVLSEAGTATVPCIMTAWDTSGAGSATVFGVAAVAAGAAGWTGNKIFTVGYNAGAWCKYYMDAVSGFKTNGTKVLGAQGATVADATDAASVILRLNDLLARCRAHGLIAT